MLQEDQFALSEDLKCDFLECFEKFKTKVSLVTPIIAPSPTPMTLISH